MQNDIFKSRGILNLIPDNFFETNRQRVENIIKKLKDWSSWMMVSVNSLTILKCMNLKSEIYNYSE